MLLHKDVGQFGLLVFTGEPLVESPLTDDGQTISSLLSVLTPDIMPIGEQTRFSFNCSTALIKQAGYQQGDILVLNRRYAFKPGYDEAKMLASQGIALHHAYAC